MPILDVTLVLRDPSRPRSGLAAAMADAAGAVFGAPPGRVWVRLAVLPATDYAENGVAPDALPTPVFVTVLHARPPQGDALAAQARALSSALGAAAGCASEQVHIVYAPAGAGRVAFGGRLVE